MGHSVQDNTIFLPESAAQIVQHMLSRKRLLAAQEVDYNLQAPQCNEVTALTSNQGGAASQNLAASFLGDAGLTEQELALVSDAVQQVIAEHSSGSIPGGLAATVGQHLSSAPQQPTPTAASASGSQQQHQSVYQSTAVRPSDGSGPGMLAAGAESTGFSSMSEILAAEQDLEQELMQLTRLQSRRFDQLTAAPEAAVAEPSTHVYQQFAAGADNTGISSRGGYIGDAGDITADMLSAALEDPDASVDDIVGILSYVLSQNRIEHGTSSASGALSPEQLLHLMPEQQAASYQGQQSGSGAGGATSADGNQHPGIPGASSSGAKKAHVDNNTARESPSASDMAQLMQQARAVHGSPGAAAAAAAAAHAMRQPKVSAIVTAGLAPGSLSRSMTQQAARENMSAWDAEGGLMFTRTQPASATASAVRSAMQASTCSSRPISPPGGRYKRKVIGRLHGSYADRASGKAATQTSSQERCLTPAELEKAWREGLRGKEDAQDFDLSTAAEVQGFGDRNGFSRVHAGAVASEAQEWLGYDGLAGSKQQQKQQQSDAVDVVVATKPKLTPELDAKLQQLYKRNVDWRRRCEGVYAQQKHADDREQMKECTFVPRINAKSAKIVQKVRLGYPVRPGTASTAANASATQQRQQRGAAAGKADNSRSVERHERYVSEEQRIIQDSKRAAYDSAVRAATAVAAVLGEEAGRQLMEEMLGKELIANSTVAHDPIESSGDGAAAGSSADGAGDESKVSPVSRSGSPRRAWLISDAALRLYADAFERQERAEQAVAEAEAQRARSWSAPRCTAYPEISPRVFDHLNATGSASPKKTREGSAPPECTFKPQTNCRNSKFPSSSKRSSQQQRSPTATLNALDSSSNNTNTTITRRLDEEFASAVEELMQKQQEADVGLRQLLGSCRTENLRDLSQPGSNRLSAAGCSSGGGHAAGPRSKSAPRGVSGRDDLNSNSSLNWNEFIDRQGTFLLVKEAKTADRAAEMSRTRKPQLSPGSKRILKEKQRAQAVGQSIQASGRTPSYSHCTQYPTSLLCGSSPTAAAASNCSPAASTGAGSPYLDRVQQQLQGDQQGSPSGSTLQQQQQQAPEWCNYSFRPVITRKAAAMKSRSFEEMSEGDRLRREAKVEQLRIMEEAKRLAGVTFSPDLSPTRSRRALTASRAAPDESNTTRNGSSNSRRSSSSTGGDTAGPAEVADSAASRARSPSRVYESVKARIQEQLRIMEEAKRLAGVTFSPDLSPTRSRRALTASRAAPDESNTTRNGSSNSRRSSSSTGGDTAGPAEVADSAASRARSPSRVYESVKARIQVRGGGLEAYMQSLEQKRRDLEEKRRQQEADKKEKEMEECTFKPVTTPVPAYLTAMANMGYTTRFIESKMAEAAMMQPWQLRQLQQQQQSLRGVSQQDCWGQWEQRRQQDSFTLQEIMQQRGSGQMMATEQQKRHME